MHARAYPPSWRIAAAVLVGVGRGGTLVLLVLLLFFETHLTNPLRLIRVFTLFCLLPQLVAWLIGRAFEVTLRIDEGALVVKQPRRSIEVPLDSIEHIERWTLPLPAQGLWLRLKSGSRFHYGLQPADLAGFLGALSAARGAQHVSGELLTHQLSTVGAPRRWYHPFLEFPIFALVPALPLFRLHQWITYGGTFGEYYLYGLQAYLLAFFIYWANATIWLVLYDAGLRAVITIGVFVLASASASYGKTARRVGEVVHRVLYFGGVAAFLARLYLLSRV